METADTTLPDAFHREVFDRIPEVKQKRILMVAAEEFAARGFSAANINDIADSAQISVGSLYKYFESKTNLYLEVVNRGFQLIEDAVQPILGSSLSLGGKVDAILDAVFSGAETQPLMNRLYSRFTAEGDVELAARLSSRLESATASAYTRLIDQAVGEGYLPTGDDARYDAFVMDNILLTLQFSLTSEYWRNRMKIYLGDDIFERRDELRSQIGRILRRSLGLKR